MIKDKVITYVVVPLLMIAVMLGLLNIAVIPLPIGDVEIQPAYACLALVAGISGSLIASLVGFGVIFLYACLVNCEQWLALALSCGILGAIFGLSIRYRALHQGVFSRHDALRFNVIQVVANVVLFGFILPALEVFFYKEATAKVFIKGWISSLVNAGVIAVFSTVLLKMYALYRKHKQMYKHKEIINK